MKLNSALLNLCPIPEKSARTPENENGQKKRGKKESIHVNNAQGPSAVLSREAARTLCIYRYRLPTPHH